MQAVSQTTFTTADFVYGTLSNTSSITLPTSGTYSVESFSAEGVLSGTPNITRNAERSVETKSTTKGEGIKELTKEFTEEDTKSEIDNSEDDEYDEYAELPGIPTDGGLSQLIPAPYTASPKRGRKTRSTVDMTSKFNVTVSNNDTIGLAFEYFPDTQQAMDITMTAVITDGEVRIPIVWTIHKDALLLIQEPLIASPGTMTLGIGIMNYAIGSASTSYSKIIFDIDEASPTAYDLNKCSGLLLSQALLVSQANGTTYYVDYTALASEVSGTTRSQFRLKHDFTTSKVRQGLAHTGTALQTHEFPTGLFAGRYQLSTLLTNHITNDYESAPNLVNLAHDIISNISSYDAVSSYYKGTLTDFTFSGQLETYWLNDSNKAIRLTPYTYSIEEFAFGATTGNTLNLTLGNFTASEPLNVSTSADTIYSGAYLVDVIELTQDPLTDDDCYIDTGTGFAQYNAVSVMGVSIDWVIQSGANHRLRPVVTSRGIAPASATAFKFEFPAYDLVSVTGTYNSTTGTVDLGNAIKSHVNFYTPNLTTNVSA